MCIRDRYEAIGSPDMTTPEGFEKAVEKAAKMYPTIDGKEMIPVGCTQFNDIGCDSFDNYLLDFLAVPYACLLYTSSCGFKVHKDCQRLFL